MRRANGAPAPNPWRSLIPYDQRAVLRNTSQHTPNPGPPITVQPARPPIDWAPWVRKIAGAVRGSLRNR